MSGHTYKTARSLYVIETIMTASRKRPKTAVQLAKITGLSERAVRGYLRHLHKEEKIYVHSWSRTANKRGIAVPAYRPGSKPDCPKPEPLTSTEVVQRYRARAKASKNKDTGYHRAIRRADERKKQHHKRVLAAQVSDPFLRTAVANGLVDPGSVRPKVTPEERADMVKLRKRGMNIWDIAAKFGVHYDTARHHINKGK